MILFISNVIIQFYLSTVDFLKIIIMIFIVYSLSLGNLLGRYIVYHALKLNVFQELFTNTVRH